ncbi:MAG TPA: hypothetical protein VJG67_02385 [Candidatus Paceibacterota bacterium]
MSLEHAPTGLGNEALVENKDFLPMVPVKNKVEWVDKDVHLPFSLEVGESTPIGMFLSPAPEKGEHTYELEVEPDHGRSGMLGRVIFQDNEGRLYRDIDLKGMGYISFPETGKPPIVDKVAITSAIRGRAEGIQTIGRALLDLRRTKLFLGLGIRTQRILAMIRLNEIIGERGEHISIADARRKKILNAGEEDEPVVMVRAYGTRGRISEVANTESSIAKTKLEDARRLVAQELKIDPEDLTWGKYLGWFMESMGKNIGRMHGNGWIHSFLTDHNMTLDARVIDLDSVQQLTSKKIKGTPRGMAKDLADSQKYLSELCLEVNKIGHLSDSDEKLTENMLEIFRREYREEYEKVQMTA